MVRVRHTVFVEAVPRAWFMAALSFLVELAEDSRVEAGRVVLPDGAAVPDLRLTTGRHLRPGAVYADDEGAARVTVRAWDRRRGLGLDLDATSPDGTLHLEGALRGPDRPRLIKVTGEAAGTRVWPSLLRARGGVTLRPEDWWTAFDRGRKPSGPPARARLDHRLARAEVGAMPVRRAADGRWEVRVTVVLRGRGVLRPFAAVALRLAGARLRRAVVRGLDDAAAQWNDEVPKLVAEDPAALRERLTAAPGDDPSK
ncbi:hypothetical protein [Streptomyces sp. NPDC057877]|uniref:hypothetical protein n=1 Tax=Streptomyces sp. NPDC057877 TaxID=3346269 RepID=UPI0036A0B445